MNRTTIVRIDQPSYNEEELKDLAQRWGKVPVSETVNGYRRSISGADAFLARGFSIEDLQNVQFCERSGSVVSLGTWPTVGGRVLYPNSWALNRQELDTYNGMKSGTTSIGSSSGTRTYTAPAPADPKATWKHLRGYLSVLKGLSLLDDKNKEYAMASIGPKPKLLELLEAVPGAVEAIEPLLETLE